MIMYEKVRYSPLDVIYTCVQTQVSRGFFSNILWVLVKEIGRGGLKWRRIELNKQWERLGNIVRGRANHYLLPSRKTRGEVGVQLLLRIKTRWPFCLPLLRVPCKAFSWFCLWLIQNLRFFSVFCCGLRKKKEKKILELLGNGG